MENEILYKHANDILNIENAIKLIKEQWSCPDDFWYLEIIRRHKDVFKKGYKNEVPVGDKRFIGYGIVSGNTKQEAIEALNNVTLKINDYHQDKIDKGNIVTKIESVSFPLESIIMLCNKIKARCYMKVNKRSMSKTIELANILKQSELSSHTEFQRAAARRLINDPEQKRPYGGLDCDIKDVNIQKQLDNYLLENHIAIFDKCSTPHGLHYVLYNRDAEELDFSQFNGKVQFIADPPILLYYPSICEE